MKKIVDFLRLGSQSQCSDTAYNVLLGSPKKKQIVSFPLDSQNRCSNTTWNEPTYKLIEQDPNYIKIT